MLGSSQEPSAALAPVTLVLGGARSGKSHYAEAQIERAAGGGTYIATATVEDDEMRARVAEHRARRGRQWRTVEENLDLADAIASSAEWRRPILVDCLTLWLASLIRAGGDVAAETDRLVAALAAANVPVILVANEVGLGIVPENALARTFRDAAGRLNQRVAALADRVVFMAAGLPMLLKDAVPSEIGR
ncbi:MAG TPA: bifunctional adenosylcobinamide kinase/adenosylcobinamide-phosphate guanylyltransferase [Stellaceae bacterium]|nr:bifunctional adenosylcobinamide kinase/adenosylcobinamide-phosphate guanylyltransferase [Stellaceae bacterium]